MGFYYFLTVISFLNSIILFIGEYSKKLLYNHKSHGNQYMRKYQFLEVVVLKKYYQYFFLNNKVALKPKEKWRRRPQGFIIAKAIIHIQPLKGQLLYSGWNPGFNIISYAVLYIVILFNFHLIFCGHYY